MTGRGRITSIGWRRSASSSTRKRVFKRAAARRRFMVDVCSGGAERRKSRQDDAPATDPLFVGAAYSRELFRINPGPSIARRHAERLWSMWRRGRDLRRSYEERGWSNCGVPSRLTSLRQGLRVFRCAEELAAISRSAPPQQTAFVNIRRAAARLELRARHCCLHATRSLAEATLRTSLRCRWPPCPMTPPRRRSITSMTR